MQLLRVSRNLRSFGFGRQLISACTLAFAFTCAVGCAPRDGVQAQFPQLDATSEHSPQIDPQFANAIQTNALQPGHETENASEFDPDAPLVVLVPGFFNSLLLGYTRSGTSGIETEPYFSQAIVETVEGRGFPVAVVNTLEPVSAIEPNGELLLDFLHHIRDRRPDLANRRMILICHSAGGLYAMYALWKDPQLPVDAIVTIGTPYQGADLVERIRNFAPILEKFANFVNLQSLVELRPNRVAEFMKSIVLPTGLRVIVSGGTQPGCFLLSCFKADRLSWLMTLTDKIVGGNSDGVITERSAFGRDVSLRDLLGHNVVIERPEQLHFNLEHWEQVHDYRLFLALGVKNPWEIEATQRDIYGRMLDYVTAPMPAPAAP